MEKIIKRKNAYQGKILDIENVDIDFGNGNISTFELVNFHTLTGVTILAIDDQDQVIMLKQYKLGLKKRILTLPSGGLEKGEDPEKIANKELQEEVGYKANQLTLMYRSHTSPGYIGSIPSYVFLARDLSPSKLEGDELEELQIIKVPFDKLIQMVRSGEIQDGKTILAILYYQQFFRK